MLVLACTRPRLFFFATYTVLHFCFFLSLGEEFLFVFTAIVLKLAMAVQTYTPHELLHLQKAPIGKELYGQLQAKLRQDQELGKVLPFRSSSVFANWLESL